MECTGTAIPAPPGAASASERSDTASIRVRVTWYREIYSPRWV